MSRLTYQEAMALSPLLPTTPGGNARFMSRRAAWLPGSDLHEELDNLKKQGIVFPPHTAAFGGHVYAQAAHAVCETLGSTISKSNLGLHTIHGYFTAAGRPDRPYVYEVAIVTRGRSFVTARVEARQPLRASSQAKPGAVFMPGDCIFTEDDVQSGDDGSGRHSDDIGTNLGVVCFTALVSFVKARPHSFGADCQEAPVQQRFASILQSRPPSQWSPSPPVDIEVMLNVVERRDIVGTFPMVDMKKVDAMAAYNEGRPLYEKRDLILYRLLGPSTGMTANDHVLAHAYAADRNGLLMATNHLEFPLNDKTATLSNSFVVHTNVDDAVMAYADFAASDNDVGGWWIQEVCFARAAAGRAIIQNKIWSPAGVHVATEYQDGLCIAQEGDGGIKVKL
ncbi:acyl- thioesterase ii [Ophiostoma piceae UAMH 11346]|uniref:Acyl-thioesterase ii n=1 Tax=Ophiostoma piceae (strain UAMH 11346) TaxID=1262450 RepID=S3C3N0_OPHP1|nr:acyl- thioesterase ii [Ophiostoma piceae UAMH 11346]